jgi:hypothetical protein
MKERTEAILETAKPIAAGLIGSTASLTLIHFLGLEWFCILVLTGMLGYFIYTIYRENLERIQTQRQHRNDQLIETIKTSDQI